MANYTPNEITKFQQKFKDRCKKFHLDLIQSGPLHFLGINFSNFTFVFEWKTFQWPKDLDVRIDINYDELTFFLLLLLCRQWIDAFSTELVVKRSHRLIVSRIILDRSRIIFNKNLFSSWEQFLAENFPNFPLHG